MDVNPLLSDTVFANISCQLVIYVVFARIKKLFVKCCVFSMSVFFSVASWTCGVCRKALTPSGFQKVPL